MSAFTKRSFILSWTLLPALLMFSSCGGHDPEWVVGGQCTSQAFPGTATVTEIITKPNGAEAHFKFAPTDPNAINQYHIQSKDDNIVLTRDGLGLPTSDWLASYGITVGANFQAIRHEIRSGTCTPLTFTFPTVPGCSAQ